MGTRFAKVIRSKRRTLSLEISREGVLIIRAPFFLSPRKIQRFVDEKAEWIRAKKEIVRKRIEAKKKHLFLPGEEYLYLGKYYPLVYSERKKPALVLGERFELSFAKKGQATRIFQEWYKIAAKDYLCTIVNSYATQYSLKYKKIRISGARTRWGSCNSRGDLSFSWRLILAPEQIIAYVVVHELAHTLHHNHSRRFWNFVEKMMPNYREHRRWLKEHGHTLNVD